MKKIKKGDYGYRNHFKRKQLFIIALLALFIIAQLVGRSFTDNDSVNSDGHGDRHGTSGGESRFPADCHFQIPYAGAGVS